MRGALVVRQITLGELIRQIESSGVTNSDGESKMIMFDFGKLYPDSVGSWRGSYNELALSYESGYGRADEFLNTLKRAVGESFEGYKGGDFVMTEDTPLWVANYGDSGNTAVTGVIATPFKIVITTAYCEY